MKISMIYDSETADTFVEVPTLEAYNGGKAHVHVEKLMETARALGAGFFHVQIADVNGTAAEMIEALAAKEKKPKKKHKKKEQLSGRKLDAEKKSKKGPEAKVVEVGTVFDTTDVVYSVYMKMEMGALRKLLNSRKDDEPDLRHYVLTTGKAVTQLKKTELAALLERADQRLLVEKVEEQRHDGSTQE